VILVAVDFWITKNISGRLLVGLKWESTFDDEGKQHWNYDSKDE
jgi:hypothetical protein